MSLIEIVACSSTKNSEMGIERTFVIDFPKKGKGERRRQILVCRKESAPHINYRRET